MFLLNYIKLPVPNLALILGVFDLTAPLFEKIFTQFWNLVIFV